MVIILLIFNPLHLLDASQNQTKLNGIEENNSFKVLPIIALITSSIEDKVIFSFLLFGLSYFEIIYAILWKYDFFLIIFLNISMTEIQCLSLPFTFKKYEISDKLYQHVSL